MPIAGESMPMRTEKEDFHDYVTTPDGTSFSTTPGGIRIIYDRMFLLRCRESPLSKTPPPNLPDIPGVTSPPLSPRDSIPQDRTAEHCAEPQRMPGQHKYGAPNFFQFPQVFDPNNNHALDIHSKLVRPNFGGPLAQYRHRQSVQANQEKPFLMQQRFNLPFSPQAEQWSPVFHPVDQSPPFASPFPFIHPVQGPTTPIFEHPSKMSQLAMWRRTHARPGDPSAQGYTTAKAPQLRSSFGSEGERFQPGPGVRRFSSGYGSQLESPQEPSNLVMTIPDDPSIIAFKPSSLKA